MRRSEIRFRRDIEYVQKDSFVFLLQESQGKSFHKEAENAIKGAFIVHT